MDQQRTANSFRTIIETSPEGVAVQSGAHLIYVNPSLVSILGYDSRKELIGCATMNLFHPEDREQFKQMDQQLGETQSETDTKFKARIQIKDGDYITVETIVLHVVFDGLPSTVLLIRVEQDNAQEHASTDSAEGAARSTEGAAERRAVQILSQIAISATNLEQLEREYRNIESKLPESVDRKFRNALKDTQSDIQRIRDDLDALQAYYRTFHREEDKAKGNEPPVKPSHRGRDIRARVLVIDDEPLLLRSLKRALRGLEVEIAESGKKAKCLIDSEQHYDAIICDLVMPDCNGMDVYDYILQKRPHMAHKVVFMTGGVLSVRGDEFVRKLQNPVIDKPFDITRVRQKLIDVIAQV